ncbi:MAG: glycosyltransferase family 4 protein [Actinomycetota bacterium]|nr:glycosyltransferase family 4 protein [Actinomycetota bacterium]
MNDFRTSKLNIAIIAPPWFPVPPPGYGGIELVVSILAEGLHRRGHDVTLFASGDSVTETRLVSVFEKAPYKLIKENVYLENIHSLAAYEMAREFDIIHDHDGTGSRLLGALVSRLFSIPVLATMHGPANKPSLDYYTSVSDDLHYIAISDAQRSDYAGLDFLATIPNAIKLDDYDFSPTSDDYLLFVGRMNEEKGAHIAASVAKKLGRRLIMIGKSSEEHEKIYFEEKVRPFLGGNIEYLGEVEHTAKVELYRRAECVLFPIQWPEPFGLVMIESMACGTPVIAIRNGSVPEVIQDGKTGFIVEDEDGMVDAVAHIGEIDRLACRQLVEREYTEKTFVERHERAYEKALAHSRKTTPPRISAPQKQLEV